MVYSKTSVIKEWLETDPSMQRFNVLVDRKRLSPTTRYGYGKSVKRFVDFYEAETPQEAIDKLEGLSIEQRTELIDSFIARLLGDGMNTSTVVQLVRGGFKKWLTLNSVEIDWPKVQGEILPGEEIVVSDRMPTKEELRRLLNVGSLRDRVIILVSTSSGLRVGTLATLTLGDVQLEEEIPRVIVKREPGRKVSRKMKGFATFITHEAKTMLLQYIEHRKKLGEKITENSPLITSEREEELGKFLNSHYLSNHWRRLLKRAHLATKNGGPWHDIHLHTLRKYFDTQCINAGVKGPYKEFWMGHIGKHLAESYFRGEVETHIAEYRKAIPYLSILAPEPQDYKALVEKVRFLEHNGKRKDVEIEKLRTQLVSQVAVGERVERLERDLEETKKLIREMLEEKK